MFCPVVLEYAFYFRQKTDEKDVAEEQHDFEYAVPDVERNVSDCSAYAAELQEKSKHVRDDHKQEYGKKHGKDKACHCLQNRAFFAFAVIQLSRAVESLYAVDDGFQEQGKAAQKVFSEKAAAGEGIPSMVLHKDFALLVAYGKGVDVKIAHEQSAHDGLAADMGGEFGQQRQNAGENGHNDILPNQKDLPGKTKEVLKISCKTKLFVFEFCVFFAETVDSSGGVNETLFAGVERMAVGADFCVDDFAFRGKCFNFKTAGTLNFCFINFWMDAFFHANLLVFKQDNI